MCRHYTCAELPLKSIKCSSDASEPSKEIIRVNLRAKLVASEADKAVLNEKLAMSETKLAASETKLAEALKENAALKGELRAPSRPGSSSAGSNSFDSAATLDVLPVLTCSPFRVKNTFIHVDHADADPGNDVDAIQSDPEELSDRNPPLKPLGTPLLQMSRSKHSLRQLQRSLHFPGSGASDARDIGKNANAAMIIRGVVFREEYIGERADADEDGHASEFSNVPSTDASVNMLSAFLGELDQANMQQCTTIKFRGLPFESRSSDILRLLVRMGFEPGRDFDFIHCPVNISVGHGAGYAFVNFADFRKALEFVQRHANRGGHVVIGDKRGVRAEISVAKDQGREALLNRHKKEVKLRNTKYRAMVW